MSLTSLVFPQTSRAVGSGVNFYSIEKEIALGRQLAEEIKRTYAIIDDPFLAWYVDGLGQALGPISDIRVPLTIQALEAEQPDVLAVPGGFLFVTSGMILSAQSEAELASAVAHGVAHVAARHGTRQATRGQLINIGTIPLIFWGGWTGYGFRQAGGLAIPLGFLQFSRAFEREADRLGLQYLYKAGYDPGAYVRLLEAMARLEEQRPTRLSKALLPFPPTEERILAAREQIRETLPRRSDDLLDTAEFRAAKAWLSALLNRR